MEKTLAQTISLFELAPVKGTGATPFSQQTVVLTKQASIALTWQANSWRAQHARLVEREAALKAEVEALQATIRDLNQRLYGAKSAQAAGCDAAGQSQSGNPRNRGQQPGSQGQAAVMRGPRCGGSACLSEAAQHCAPCGEAFAPFPGAEESTIIKVQVQAYIRRIQRPRYQKMCECPQVAGIVTAPPAPRVIPKSPLGVSVWTQVLLDKYLYGRPTYRFCEALRHHGLHLSQGTLTDGLQRLAGLCAPVARVVRAAEARKTLHGMKRGGKCLKRSKGKRATLHLWIIQSVFSGVVPHGTRAGADVPSACCQAAQGHSGLSNFD
jgi:transposase